MKKTILLTAAALSVFTSVAKAEHQISVLPEPVINYSKEQIFDVYIKYNLVYGENNPPAYLGQQSNYNSKEAFIKSLTVASISSLTNRLYSIQSALITDLCSTNYEGCDTDITVGYEANKIFNTHRRLAETSKTLIKQINTPANNVNDRFVIAYQNRKETKETINALQDMIDKHDLSSGYALEYSTIANFFLEINNSYYSSAFDELISKGVDPQEPKTLTNKLNYGI
jgi:hypothetical protein